EMDIAHAENDGGHRAAGGSARRLARVPRVARHSGERTIGDGFPPELGHRGLADEDRALLAQAGNRRRVMRRRRIRREPGSEPRRHAGDVEVVFNANRDAIDETSGRARHPTGLGIPCAPARAFAIHAAIGVHHAVRPIDLLEHGVNHLDRREIFAPIAREQLRNRQEGGGVLWRFRYDARSSVRLGSYPPNSILSPRPGGFESKPIWTREGMTNRRQFLKLTLGLPFSSGALSLKSDRLHAQEPWPTRTITIVVPFPPGGVADFAARPLAAHLSDTLRQNVVVENKGGAGGGIGHAYVARAEPDGHTIMPALPSLAVIPEGNRLAGKPVPYEMDQFVPLARMLADPPILAVKNSSPWNS